MEDNNLSKAMEGNENARKYKNDEDMIKIFLQYCEHIAKGYSKNSFVECDYRTIESYIKDFPAVLDSEKMERAFRKNLLFWESLGLNGTLGIKSYKTSDGKEVKLNGFNAATWIFNMKNRHGWRDTQDILHHGDAVSINTNVNLPPEFAELMKEKSNKVNKE